MKKLILFLFLIVLALSTVACTVSNSSTSENPTTTTSVSEEKVSSSTTSVAPSTSSLHNASTSSKQNLPTTYNISVDSTSEFATVSANKYTAQSGEIITIGIAISNSDYSLDYLKINGETITPSGSVATFTMPAQNVSITFALKKKSYNVSVTSSNGGTITPSKNSGVVGEVINLTISATTGYKLSDLKVNGNSISFTTNSASFSMPSGGATITSVFVKINYTITRDSITGGTVSISKINANYGDIITLENTPDDEHIFSHYIVDGQKNTTGSFTMPAKNITIGAVFTKSTFTITTEVIGGGTLNVSKTTASVGETITLTNSPHAGYVFSSYKVDGEINTTGSFIMPAKNITVSATFISGIAGLNEFNYTSTHFSSESAAGTVTLNGSSLSSTKASNSFSYSRLNGDFYFETHIATGIAIYNNDATPKFGIAVNVGKDTLFFCVDALANGWDGNGYGNNTWTFIINAYGDNPAISDYYWNTPDNPHEDNASMFYTNYGSPSTYLKMGIMRVGSTYHFFVDNIYKCSLFYPNMTSTAKIGILTMNMACEVKDSKYSNNSSVINNAKAYYNITNSNVTSINLDGKSNDWKENASNVYGYSVGEKYFYAAAFTSGEQVNIVLQARTSNYITTSADWWSNTNVELRLGHPSETSATDTLTTQLYAAANGEKSSNITAFSYNAEQDGSLYRVTFELQVPISLWNGGTPTLGFAFCSEDPVPTMLEGFKEDRFWTGIESITYQHNPVGPTGLLKERQTPPSNSLIKTNVGAGDPFVMLHNGTYYLYGTSNNGKFYVSSSTDMMNWGDQRVCFNVHDENCDSQVNYDLWAPEVYYNSSTNKFVMFYSGARDVDQWGSGTNLHNYPKVYVATCDTPNGTFVNATENDLPLLYANEEIATIDATLLVLNDHQDPAYNGVYLYYCKDIARNHYADYLTQIGFEDMGFGTAYSVSEIWVVKLDSTWTRLDTSFEPQLIIRPDQKWEFLYTEDGWKIPEGQEGVTFGRAWNEGPFVWRENNKIYLTYSANPFWSEHYGVGVAVSYWPTHSFDKVPEPVVKKDPGYTAGTGHSMMFKDKNGQLWCAFHSFYDPSASIAQETRIVLFAPAWFKDGQLKVEYENDIVYANGGWSYAM